MTYKNLVEAAAAEASIRSVLKDGRVSHIDALDMIRPIFATSDSSVRRWRQANGVVLAETESATAAPDDTYISIEGDSGELSIGKGEIPCEIKAGEGWAPLLEFFGLPPEDFEVQDDSVKITRWNMGKGTPEGSINKTWLWSYKAKFRRITPQDNAVVADISAEIERVQKWKIKPLVARTAGSGLGDPVTYVHQQGDEQIGKSAGGSLEGFIGRTEDALQQSLDRLKVLQKRGHNIEAIADIACGDVIENIFGHYPSQGRTSTTLRSQMQLARTLDVERTKAFSEFGLPIKKAYTLSNHGEIRQVIGQSPYTSESDNYDLMIAEQVHDVLQESPLFDQIEWFIPHDEWWTHFDLSGTQCALTHGHKADGKGTIEKWFLAQRGDILFEQNIRIQIAFMGHRHTGFIKDVSGTTIMQTPSLDGGSDYFAAGFGQRSRHGIITALVGQGFRFGWSEAVML